MRRVEPVEALADRVEALERALAALAAEVDSNYWTLAAMADEARGS